MNLRSLFSLIVGAVIFGVSRSYLEPIINFGSSNLTNSFAIMIIALLPAALVYVVLRNLWEDDQDARYYYRGMR